MFSVLRKSIISRLPLVNRYLWLRQFLKFSLVGGICTIFDFIIYIFLTRFFSFWQSYYLWANFLSIALAATINFVWNRKWTFRVVKRDVFGQYFKFWIAVVLGLLVYQLILYLSVEWLGVFDLLGKIIGAIIAWILRFFINKFWTFK